MNMSETFLYICSKISGICKRKNIKSSEHVFKVTEYPKGLLLPLNLHQFSANIFI